MQRAAPELVERTREADRDPGDSGTLVRRVVGVAQPVPAVSDQVRAGLLEVEPPPIDLDQVFDDLGGRLAFRAREHR
jgi:hypothetical protein